MDSEVVLNAIFDTYKENEIVKARQLSEAITRPPRCKLFQNGKELFDISNLTITQSRTTTSGEFKVQLVDIKYAFSPEFDYHIEVDMTHKSGTTTHMFIRHVVFHDSIITDNDVTFQYDAVSVDYKEDIINGY